MRAWSLAALATVALVLAACGGSDDGSGSSTTATDGAKDPIVIGTVTARTGAFGVIDEPTLTMFKIKIDEVNKAGGIDGRKIKIISRDTESVPQQGSQATTDLIDQGADFIVVSCDYDFAAPAALVAQRAGKVTLSTCAQSAKFGVQGIGDKAFTVASSDASEGGVHATFAKDKGLKDAFVLLDTSVVYNQGYANGFKKAWKAEGGNVVGEAKWKNSDSSIATQITKIKQANPGFIVMPTYQPGGIAAIRQMRAAGIDVPILTSDGMDGTCWNKAAPGVKDVYVTSPVSMYGDDPNPKVNQIFAEYKKQVGELPCIAVNANAYAAAEALTTGMERADDPTNSDQVKEALEGDPLDLIIGKTDFDTVNHIALNRPQTVLEHAEPHPIYQDTLTPAAKMTLADSVG